MQQSRELTRFVIGTAGHIDHGKSSLIRRLTGIDPDRLEEEKLRGMTIDIGFANMKLPDGRIVGFIDVPGHEKFVKNMVAGATAVRAVLLVIAADDSIMPQTREHLAILRFLDIRDGIVALTKKDLVDSDTLELVKMEIESLVAGTFLEGKPIVPVSSTTGEGIEDLKAEIQRMTERLAAASTGGIFRYPIQRVFSSTGFGTVVTGVTASGQVKIGDPVEIQPGGETGRIRGLQAYHGDVEVASAGHSAAINIADLHKSDLERGMVAGTPGYLRSAEGAQVFFKFSPISPEIRLKDFADITFHAGSHEQPAKLAFIGDRKFLNAGEETYAIVRLSMPAVLWPGLRFIVRRPSPPDTLGGGIILGIADLHMKRTDPRIAEYCEARLTALDDTTAFSLLIIRESKDATVRIEDLCAETGLLPAEIAPILAKHLTEGRIREIVQGRFIAGENLSQVALTLYNSLERLHLEKPLSVWFERRDIRAVGPKEDILFDAAVAELAATKRIEEQGGKLRKAGYRAPLSDKQLKLIEKILDEMKREVYETHKPAVLAESWKIPLPEIEKVYRLLIQQQEVVELPDGVFLSKDAVAQAESKLRKYFEGAELLRSGDFKDIIGSARKTAISLLDYFEKTGITIRRGNEHSLRKFGAKQDPKTSG